MTHTIKKKGPADIKRYFDLLFKRFGPQSWWPAKSRFEVIVGAILTQNTNWTNVEKAISRLKEARCLTPSAIHQIEAGTLAEHIRPAGYFNIKARRLKHFTAHLFTHHGGSLGKMLGQRDGLRDELLSINGIGPETADSIMLYAGGHPEFVVDAYTKRIFSRHGLIDANASYDETKAVFTYALPGETGLFNEYHALIVRTAKEHCVKKEPRCGKCPLAGFL
ncbi:MAG: endonuclease III domain-containing protein [Deltaproteobacteria bacterium]